jgi:hypothetical protein
MNMKTTQKLPFLTAALLAGLLSAGAQPFQSGSNGSYGALNVTTDITLDVPVDGIFHCTTINIQTGRTLRFRRNALNTPVILLATGDVTIVGAIDVSGGRGSPSAPGLGGPGGFDGGAPGSVGLPGGDGQGPGGGKAGTLVAADAAGPASYATVPAFGLPARRGLSYGNALLFPIVGGSGGGGGAGNPGWGGGGGGGALVIASSTRIVLTGQLRANGGNGHSGAVANAGSGGAIRLIAPAVSGTGFISVTGDGLNPSGGHGRIRIDSMDRSGISLNYNPQNTASVGGFMQVFPNPMPRLDIVEAAGRAIPLDAGPTQVLLPSGSPANQVVKVRARDFGQNVPVRLVVTPDNGPAQTYDADINNTGVNPAEASITVNFPANVLTHVHVWTR